ncbi:hypothetical protein HmCmsJML066_01399 [Escherichia coli]|nr:hypothetical protein HmCmsJML066_01399 [Escherichia coli]
MFKPMETSIWGSAQEMFEQTAAMTWRDAQHFGSLSRTDNAIDDILKDFEAIDFFHGEHSGIIYSHRKLLIRKK